MAIDKNDIAYWFPKLLLSEQPVPKTIIIQTSGDLWDMLDGKVPHRMDEFLGELKHAISIIGHPVFLRTGHTSGKHNAKQTCLLETTERLAAHIFALVEESGMAMPSLPMGTWAVRERLKFGNPAAFTAFNGLPIRIERRYFFRDGKVEHHIPYWPKEVFQTNYYGMPLPDNWGELLWRVNQESKDEVLELTARTAVVAKRFSGWWSVDWIITVTGWVAIDMARGEDSWGNDYRKGETE
ncbi:hypothetical protein LCGC14_2655370 [marine sediment metagenome]|uniref:Uncharacterized protein n=1 Tax=marine sediment metagenome TaxID=412755 RepID=A0A0F9CKK5_9ZZZZ